MINPHNDHSQRHSPAWWPTALACSSHRHTAAGALPGQRALRGRSPSWWCPCRCRCGQQAWRSACECSKRERCEACAFGQRWSSISLQLICAVVCIEHCRHIEQAHRVRSGRRRRMGWIERRTARSTAAKRAGARSGLRCNKVPCTRTCRLALKTQSAACIDAI